MYVWLHGDLSVDQSVIGEDKGLNSWDFAVSYWFLHFYYPRPYTYKCFGNMAFNSKIATTTKKKTHNKTVKL